MATENLNNVIDINDYPVKQAKKSNSKLDQKNSNTDTRIRVLHNPFIPKVSQT